MEADPIVRQGALRLFSVDVRIYSLRAILKTAYWFTERAFLHLQFRAEHLVEIRLRAKSATADPDEIVGDFLNDLIDQRLRELVGAETEKSRDLIIAHALSKTALIHRELETADPFAATKTAGSSAERAVRMEALPQIPVGSLLDEATARDVNSALRASVEKQISSDQLRR